MEATVVESWKRYTNVSSCAFGLDSFVALKDEARSSDVIGADTAGGGELFSSCFTTSTDIIAVGEGECDCTLAALPKEFRISPNFFCASRKAFETMKFFFYGLVRVSHTQRVYSTFLSLESSLVLNCTSSVFILA